jgi:hypothetical protein
VAGDDSLGAFALLRLTHSYGAPGPGFEHLDTPAHTMMSIFSVQKYPPSLHYLLATPGIVFPLFSIFDGSGRCAGCRRRTLHDHTHQKRLEGDASGMLGGTMRRQAPAATKAP